MLTLTARTSTGKHTINCPEYWDEVSVEQYQRIIGEWDKEDWIQLFSILSGLEASGISESKDGHMEGALYQSIEFALSEFDWEKLKVPKEITLRPIWLKDCPTLPVTVKIPKGIGSLSIGQAIQARKSLEQFKDRREGLSMVTAIYLQPLIDNGKFDMLKVIELEYLIKKMKVTEIYPVGFFLLTRLYRPGNRFTRIWLRIKSYLLTRRIKT